MVKLVTTKPSFIWIAYFLVPVLPFGVFFPSAPLFLISVGEGALSFFCNGDDLFAGFTLK